MIELAFLGDDSSEALKNGFLAHDPNGTADLEVPLRVGSPLCSFVDPANDGAPDPFFAALEPREPSLLTLGEPCEEFKAPTAPKRRRNELTCAERIQLIQDYIASGESVSQQSLANKYGVSRSCVNRLLKIRDVILQQSAELGPADRKRFKKATYSEIEHLLLAWIAAVRERHERVNGPMIQAKGLSFARELRIESFTASSGWLERFLKRNNLHLFELNGGQGAHRSTRHSLASQVPPSFAPTDHELFAASTHTHAVVSTAAAAHFSEDPSAASAGASTLGPLALAGPASASASAAAGAATSPSAHPLDRTAGIASEAEWLAFLRAELAAYAPRDRFNLDECTLLLPPALTKHQQNAHSAASSTSTPSNGVSATEQSARCTPTAARQASSSSSTPNASMLPKRSRTKKFLLPTQDRLVVSLCFNQQGERERPLLVSRFPLPAEDAAAAAPDVHYVCHPAALLTSRIFENWLLQFERRLAADGRHVALVLDRIAPHAGLSQSALQRLHHIRLLFLPPALSPTTQPFQRGIVISFKQKYRQAMEATMGTCKLGIIPSRTANKHVASDFNNTSFGGVSSLMPSASAAVSSAAHQTSSSLFLHAGGSPGPLAFVHDPSLNPFADAFQFGVGAVATAAHMHVHQMQAHEAGTHMGLDLLDDPLALPHSQSYSMLNPVTGISSAPAPSATPFAKKRSAALEHSSNRSMSSFFPDDEHDQRVVTIVDAIRWVSEAWRRLPFAAIAKGFALAHYDTEYLEPVFAASSQTQLHPMSTGLSQVGGAVQMAFAPSAVGLRATSSFPSLIIPPAASSASAPLVTLLPTTPAPPASALTPSSTAASNPDESSAYALSVSSRRAAAQQPHAHARAHAQQLRPPEAADEEREQPDDSASCASTNPVESASVLQMSVAEVIKDQLARSKDLKQTFGWSGFGRRSAPAATALSQLKLKTKKPLPKRKPTKRAASLRARPQLPLAERLMGPNLSAVDAYNPSVGDALHCVRVLDLFARSRAPTLLLQVRSLEASLGQLLDAAFPTSSTGSTSAATSAASAAAAAGDLFSSSGLASGSSAPPVSASTSANSSSRGAASSARGGRARSRPARKTRLPRSLKARTASVTDDALAVEFDDAAGQGADAEEAEAATATTHEVQMSQLDEDGLNFSVSGPFADGSNEGIDHTTTAQDEFDVNSESP